MVQIMQALQNPAYRLADMLRMIRKSGSRFTDQIMQNNEGFGATRRTPSPFRRPFLRVVPQNADRVI